MRQAISATEETKKGKTSLADSWYLYFSTRAVTFFMPHSYTHTYTNVGMNAAGKVSCTPLNNLNLSFLMVAFVNSIGSWLVSLLALSLVETV